MIDEWLKFIETFIANNNVSMRERFLEIIIHRDTIFLMKRRDATSNPLDSFTKACNPH